MLHKQAWTNLGNSESANSENYSRFAELVIVFVVMNISQCMTPIRFIQQIHAKHFGLSLFVVVSNL